MSYEVKKNIALGVHSNLSGEFILQSLSDGVFLFGQELLFENWKIFKYSVRIEKEAAAVETEFKQKRSKETIVYSASSSEILANYHSSILEHMRAQYQRRLADFKKLYDSQIKLLISNICKRSRAATVNSSPIKDQTIVRRSKKKSHIHEQQQQQQQQKHDRAASESRLLYEATSKDREITSSHRQEKEWEDRYAKLSLPQPSSSGFTLFPYEVPITCNSLKSSSTDIPRKRSEDGKHVEDVEEYPDILRRQQVQSTLQGLIHQNTKIAERRKKSHQSSPLKVLLRYSQDQQQQQQQQKQQQHRQQQQQFSPVKEPLHQTVVDNLSLLQCLNKKACINSIASPLMIEHSYGSSQACPIIQAIHTSPLKVALTQKEQMLQRSLRPIIRFSRSTSSTRCAAIPAKSSALLERSDDQQPNLNKQHPSNFHRSNKISQEISYSSTRSPSLSSQLTSSRDMRNNLAIATTTTTSSHSGLSYLYCLAPSKAKISASKRTEESLLSCSIQEVYTKTPAKNLSVCNQPPPPPPSQKQEATQQEERENIHSNERRNPRIHDTTFLIQRGQIGSVRYSFQLTDEKG